MTYGILAQAPEIIKFTTEEKIYIKDEAIHKTIGEDLGGFVVLEEGNLVYLPYLLSDEGGYYSSILRNFWSKAFHQKCNVCQYEWEAKWYEVQCPNCGSTDYTNISS